MKNICFLISNMNHSGGTERVTSLISNRLAERGYQIFILSLSEGNNPFFPLHDSIKTFGLYSSKVNFKSNFIGCVWKVRQFIRKHHIQTLIVVDSISCLFTIPALCGLNVQHICWEHFNYKVDLGTPFRSLGRKMAAQYCDYVVTLTQKDKKLWEAGLKKISAEIIPISNPTPYQNITHFPDLRKKTVIALGRLTAQKGFDLLLDAWAEVCEVRRDWKLQIIGSGEDETELKTKVNQLKINSTIEFIPTAKDVTPYYESASFYCLSSRFEGLPMVLLEAQAYGLPIVSFDCDTGPSDLIQQGKEGYLVECFDTQKLAEAMLSLMGLKEQEYRQMCENAKQKSQQYHSEVIVSQWIEILGSNV